MLPHALSVAVFFGQVAGYVALSTVMQLFFYHLRQGREEEWKIQPRCKASLLPKANNGKIAEVQGSQSTHSSLCPPTNRDQPSDFAAASSVDSPSRRLFYWWLPALGLLSSSRQSLKSRHHLHSIFCTFNLCVASAFLAFTVECHLRGWNRLIAAKSLQVGDPSFIRGLPFLKAVAAQTLVEYYWHRLMHLRPFYKAFHKLHHHYKSPRPFDDLFIHPVEAFGYYVILYVIPTCCLGDMPMGDFALYMGLHGVCGVLDHCGVDIRLGPVYSASDHDVHHQLFNVNYGFPFVIMDCVHGTIHH